MTTEYSDQKIREILAKLNGQGKLAEQAIRALITRDPVFLQSLVTPFIGGIIAHGIDRARKQGSPAEPASVPSRMAAPTPIKPSAVQAQTLQQRPAATPPMPTATLDGLMQAWAKKFDDKAGDVAIKPGTVSKSHIDAIAAMAVRHTGKKP